MTEPRSEDTHVVHSSGACTVAPLQGPVPGRQEGEVAQDVVHGLGQVARFATSLQFSPEAPTEVIAWSAPCNGRLQ